MNSEDIRQIMHYAYLREKLMQYRRSKIAPPTPPVQIIGNIHFISLY